MGHPVTTKRKTKKAATVEAPEAKPVGLVTGPRHEGGVTYLSAIDLANWELMKSKLANAVLMRELVELRVEKEQRESRDRVNNMRLDMQGSITEIQQVKARLALLEQEIAAVYQMELSSICYDDVTGRIETIASGCV